jgi:hypothetical protein
MYLPSAVSVTYTKYIENIDKGGIFMASYFKKTGTLALVFATVLNICISSNVAFANVLTSASVTLDNNTSNSSSSYTFQFSVKTAGSIGKIGIVVASAASNGSTVPISYDSSSASFTSFKKNGTSDAAWPGSNLVNTVNGTLTIMPTAPESETSGDTIQLILGGIHNNVVDSSVGANNCSGVAGSTDTCYFRITTYAANGTTPVDTATATYTVISAVTVSATVDASLTFNISGVAASATNDGNTASVTSTATTIPFSNLTVGTAKTAQQGLTVATNAQNGYNTYHKFTTSSNTQIMAGTYAGNVISPFTGAGGTATWSTPVVWSLPNGTAKNVNSGWIGMRTNNAGISGFGTTTFFAPPAYNTSGVGNAVMANSGPDNGTTVTYITYQVSVNSYQPSDVYTGTEVYNVVPVY